MIERLFELPFAIVAHRGGKGEVAENTIKAMRHALEVGADAIEVDLRQTKEGALILLHDPDFKRVAGVDARPGDLELSWIKERIRIFGSEPVPTLEEVLETVNGRVPLFLEIKEEGIEERVVEAICKAGAGRWCVIISFFESVIKNAKALDPSLHTGLIYNRLPHKVEEARALGATFILPRYDLLTSETIALAHKNRLKAITWTVDDVELLMRLVSYGIDGVATDYPKKFVRLREKMLE